MAKQKQQTIIQQLVVRAPQRKTSDVGTWRNAMRSADSGKMRALYELYDDLLIDGVLSDAVDKRKDAICNAELSFVDKNGREITEITDMIDSLDFEELLRALMDVKFYGRSAVEFDFSNGFSVFQIPHKHIDLNTQSILINDTDEIGISYVDDDNILVLGKQNNYGLFLKTAPFAIWKRGGFGDYAQWLEIFGMPQRVGKYSSYDPQSRLLLEEALERAGSASWVVIPKESDVETVSNGGSGNNGATYNDFRKACNEEILISILGQTLTTVQGDKGARSLGEVHKDVEEGKNRADMRFIQRVLNQHLLPILEKRGYPVAGGYFVFPESAVELSVDELVKLTNVIDIPASFIYDKYSIPVADSNEAIAGKAQQKVTDEDDDKKKKGDEENENDKKDDKKNKEKKFRFFANAPTKERGLFTKLTDSITGRLTLSDKYSINVQSLLKQALNEIYGNAESGREQAIVSRPLFDITNEALEHAISSAFTPEFGKNNKEFINEFAHNNAVFSAFKNHRQTNDLVALLHNDKGELRSFREFRKLALAVSKNYNINWLQTEYNTAVRAARSAVNYRKYLESKHLYPNLEYVQSTASKQRESHLAYVGTILPIEHPWWDEHMPPSDWNCACSVRPTDKEPTEVPSSELLNPVFKNNPGKTAQFLNMKEHPYIKGVCPDFDGCKYRESGDSIINFSNNEAPNKPECDICLFVQVMLNKNFELLKDFNNGGKLLIHNSADKSKSDFKDKSIIGREIASTGKIVKILPDRMSVKNPEYDVIFGSLKGTKQYGKLPDFEIDNILYEYESFQRPFKYSKISHMIGRGATQSPFIIIDNNKGASDRYIRRSIYRKLNQKTFKLEINEVWVYEKGSVRLLFKKQ